MFEWMDPKDFQTDEDKLLTLKARLMAHRARRIILDAKIDEAMSRIQNWEIERGQVAEREDNIADLIDLKKKLAKTQPG